MRLYAEAGADAVSRVWYYTESGDHPIDTTQQALSDLGYAGGFSMGSLVGLWLEEKLAIGMATVQIISAHSGVEIARCREALLAGSARSPEREARVTSSRNSRHAPC